MVPNAHLMKIGQWLILGSLSGLSIHVVPFPQNTLSQQSVRNSLGFEAFHPSH